MPIQRAAAPNYTAIRRGSTVIKEIRRGSTLMWSGATIRDGFDWDGFLQGWINELCSGEDLGTLISDGLGGIRDGLDNEIGRVVQYVEGGVNDLGLLVADTSTSLVDAYCGAWGGSAPPDGLLGLINGIPLIGSELSKILKEWFGGTLEIDSLIGKIPVVGQVAQMIGLVPDQLTGAITDPLNYVIDEAGNVVGTLTCGQYKNIAGSILEPICYVIGVVGQSARMLIPDGLMNLSEVGSRFRHPTLLPADDGYLEVQLSQLGDPGFATQVFRNYSNDGSGAVGIGIDIRNATAGIVRRVGGTETIVAPQLGQAGPGDVLRLIRAGTEHTLLRNGDPIGSWNGVSGGAGARSVAMVMNGAKEFGGSRLFSPALSYLEAG
ncbi:minor tail protein [Mycobacterium phage Quesadilla]|uniref:Uncharacterized protein n=1 Tax=Mycobacterium phage Quesadilla TaxID=2664226 RepID=A0A5Q2WC03_9CAUD|nr:minor tail protein [Mycobacterium phage Quesadilla]QGH75292.1 hypothetical protein SEA_QUESADILLA_44 [Mycobacterium phage Quesadilla]